MYNIIAVERLGSREFRRRMAHPVGADDTDFFGCSMNGKFV